MGPACRPSGSGALSESAAAKKTVFGDVFLSNRNVTPQRARAAAGPPPKRKWPVRIGPRAGRRSAAVTAPSRLSLLPPAATPSRLSARSDCRSLFDQGVPGRAAMSDPGAVGPGPGPVPAGQAPCRHGDPSDATVPSVTGVAQACIIAAAGRPRLRLGRPARPPPAPDRNLSMISPSPWQAASGSDSD